MPLLLDAGLATGLEDAGHVLDDPLWSARLLLDDPQSIVDVHRAHLRAGAQVLTTASYQLSFEALYERGLNHKDARALFRKSVALAHRAMSLEGFSKSQRMRPAVAASLGAFGAFLNDGSEYRGHYPTDQKQLVAFHSRRVEALLAGQPDLLAFETIPCAEEARAIAQVLSLFPRVAAWVSFSARDNRHASSGETIEACARPLLNSPNLLAIGVNCTAPHVMGPLLGRLRRITPLPLVAYPNGGSRWDGGARRFVPPAHPIDFCGLAASLRAHGALFVGGCCQTNSDDLAAMAQGLKKR